MAASQLPHVSSAPFAGNETITWGSAAHLQPAIHTVLATADGVSKGALYAVPPTPGDETPRVLHPTQHTIVWVPALQPPPANGLLVASNVSGVDAGFIVQVAPGSAAAASSSAAATAAADPAAAVAGVKRKPGRPKKVVSPSAAAAGKQPMAAAAAVATAAGTVAAIALDDDEDDDGAESEPIIKKKKAPKPVTGPVKLIVKDKGTVKLDKVKVVIEEVVAALGMSAHYTVNDSDGSYCGPDGVCEAFTTHIEILRHIKDTFQMDVTNELEHRPNSLFGSVLKLTDDHFE